MMGVYIKGMKMPKECEYCGFCRFYPENGNVWCNAKNIILKTKWKEPNWTHLDVKRPEWCPLVEVPEPHEKLVEFIDVATFEDEDSGTEEVNLGEVFAAYLKMRESKPIIEAEGE